MTYLQKPLYFHKGSTYLFLCVMFCSIFSCTKQLKEGNELMATENLKVSALAAGSKPNIIIFIADDYGYEIPTFTGGQSYTTPNMDAMATNGIFFQQANSHPDGFPSRLAFLTGKYNFRNYVSWGKFSYSEKTVGNMLQDAGYKTCYVGKWQCDDGDKGLTKRGFEKYQVFFPFSGDGQRKGRYKDPIVYQNADYLPSSATQGKYSEDMFSDYLCNFIDSNKTKPFFGIYALNLVAAPYVPSPDHPEYAGWNSANDQKKSDPKYFPSMVSYADKMVGKIIKKIKDDGLANNTIILFIADNATQKSITSRWKNTSIEGQKTRTNMFSTLTPLVVTWPGTIAPGTKSQALIDYTDFMPTFADIARIPRPTTYGTLDGVSFYDNMKGIGGIDRDWVFCHWDGNLKDTVPRVRFVNNNTYKLFDTLNYSQFYNMQKDTFQLSPIPQNKLTPQEKKIKQSFIKVLKSEHI